jgi:hypothetical protein
MDAKKMHLTGADVLALELKQSRNIPESDD